MASARWIYNSPGVHSNEAEIPFRSPQLSWGSEDDGSLVSELDKTPWTPVDPAGSIYLSRSTDSHSQDFESVQHFFPEHYRKPFIHFDRDVNLDPFSLAIHPSSERHQGPPVVDVCVMGSPVHSAAESRSVTEYGSSASCAWSDRGSDAGGSYQGARRPSEREAAWNRASIEYSPNMLNPIDYAAGFSGGSGLSGGGAYAESFRSSFVDPRQVQQSPGVVEEPAAEEDEEEATTQPSYPLQQEHWTPEEARGRSPSDEANETYHIKSEEDQHSDQQSRRFPARRSRQDQGRWGSSGRVTRGVRNMRRCSEHPGLTFRNTAEWRSVLSADSDGIMSGRES